MMPGGERESYDALRPLLEQMAAPDGKNGKCVSYVGSGGAGHFVKMVHNGIEYGLMQLIAETYDLFRSVGRVNNAELAKVYADWVTGKDVGSFLLEITAKIFRVKDPETGRDLLDLIADRAGQKGTGKWTTEAAMDLGVPIPTITAAVEARILTASPLRQMRKEYPGEELAVSIDPRELVALCRGALELGSICAYIQGFELIRTASETHGWGVNLSETARIWRGGCIIRSALLPIFERALTADDTQGRNDLLHRFSGKRQENWRRLVAVAAHVGVPVPALSSALNYYDTLRRERLPQNLIQAQRDFFGAHTYERTDKTGSFHTDWNT
jgi:6-phosphogluconate dehydrogenase